VHSLVAVEEGQHAERALAELAPAEGPDRGLAWNLVLGVLRRRGAIDSLLEPRLSQGVSGLDPAVRAILRVGVYDALATRTPVRAAVHQAVEVSRAVGMVRASRLINAVLRRATEQQMPEDVWLDLPPWLQKRWSGWQAWVRRLAEEPRISVAAQRSLPDDLEGEDVTVGGQAIPNARTLTGRSGRIEQLPGYSEGDWWVMDPAAMAIADLACRHTGEGGSVLDACAAPGGKTFRISAAGFRVVAVDQDARRLSVLREGAARLGMEISAHAHLWGADAALDIGLFDTVVVDAPCTGLGTVRRHPEIRWRRLPSDPAAMAIRQISILESASQHVGPGGVLIYAVCSPEPEEGPEVVAQMSGWRVIDRWASAPPTGDEDAHQAFVLVREDG